MSSYRSRCEKGIKMNTIKDLDVYKIAYQMVLKIYKITNALDRIEKTLNGLIKKH